MNPTALKSKLQQPYTREAWLSIAKDIFGNLSVLNKPIDIDYKKDFVKSFRQLGFVRLDDGKSLAMIEVKVDDTKDLYRNKVELRNLTTQLIDEDSNHGVLVIYDNDSGKYRFTFAAKESVLNETTMQVETKETHPKRFTYLLGPGESCFTPAIQLSKLAAKGEGAKLKDVVDAFNVEAVNKKFFNDYKQHYTAFVERLSAHGSKQQVFQGDVEKSIRDFVKKMLGRIVFLYFLQKKGWMGVPATATKWEGGDPNFLKNLFEQAGEDENFYPSWLVPLFQTLNDNNRAELFEMPDGQKVKVPCLNGGLFEPDGLRTEFLTFTPELFTALFKFFDEYNFTIYEDDPEERFLAVDPEMLGHIFENLLEDNKDKGAY